MEASALNSKIPVTHVSAAKLRASISKRRSKTQTSQRVVTKVKRGVPLNFNDDNTEDATTSTFNSQSVKRQSGEGLQSVIVKGNLEAETSCFHEKLNEWIAGVHRELFHELEGSDEPIVSVHSGIRTNYPASRTSSLDVQAPASTTSIASYAMLIENQGACNNSYSRSHPRRLINSPGTRSRKLTSTPPQEPSIPTLSQPVGNGPCLPPSSYDLRERGVEELPFVYPDDRHCYGFERFNQMSSVFIQPAAGLFNFLNTICPKFLFATRQDIFHHETFPPIFTITQTSNQWTDLKFLIHHNDYSGGSLMTDLCFTIECNPFYESFSRLHSAKFYLADSSGVQLGSYKYYSTSRYHPILFIECDLTRETFFVRSRNYSPGYQDSDFFVRQVTECEDGDEGDQGQKPDNSLVAVISRRIPRTVTEANSVVYPLQERVVISFCGKVHPYTKGTLIAASLVLKHDLFK